MVVYIAGKMAGCEDTYQQTFAEVAERLENEKDYFVLNPAILPRGMDGKNYMPICLRLIDCCDAIYMIDGWQDSKGARLEKAYAEYQGKGIMYERDRQ